MVICSKGQEPSPSACHASRSERCMTGASAVVMVTDDSLMDREISLMSFDEFSVSFVTCFGCYNCW